MAQTHSEGAESHVTTNHDEIRKWVEARGGKPATVKSTGGKEDAGILRIEFQDRQNLEEIPWDEFFEKFDRNDLAFLYQDRLKSGEESRFFKFVRRGESKTKH
jgi:glutathione synthase/RimK-type ligase-like ATP-grasp enzyme